jgi:hypothetical protein
VVIDIDEVDKFLDKVDKIVKKIERSLDNIENAIQKELKQIRGEDEEDKS